MGEMVRANPTLRGAESYLWEFLFDTYATTQASAVRRQADIGERAASLGRLIFEMGNSSHLLTREWWISLWREGHDDTYWQRIAEDAWAKEFGGKVGVHLDPAIPIADLQSLQQGLRSTKEFVDRNVAHLDARSIATRKEPPTPTPPDAPTRRGADLTLNQVHDAIDLTGGLFRKYGNLITAASWGDLTPALQHDWEAVFRIPWIDEDANE